MADKDLILRIDSALAANLVARAKAAGQSVEDYALGVLQRTVEQSGLGERGFGENETSWTGGVVDGQAGAGFAERDPAYWRELEAICDEADRTGGVPWEQVEARLRNFGQKL